MSIATAGPKVVANVVTQSELCSSERDEAYALLRRHFDGVTRGQFELDLSEKNVVLLLRDAASGALAGFSTMAVFETRIDDAPISVVCSGDTIVDRSAWGSAALPREWIGQ